MSEQSLYGAGDFARQNDRDEHKKKEPHRSAFRRDYARLIHSPAFRRLQGKTQVFPGYESDFYRNRLTHSLEVAQIAKSIAIRLNATDSRFQDEKLKIDPDLVEFAGLAHDLGHPPFGHNGEAALDECMREHGGFEGNAQTLRILSKLEKKATSHEVSGATSPFGPSGEDLRCGLNLTYRSLASILKYDSIIPERSGDRTERSKIVKGYYACDTELVTRVKKHVLGEDFTGNFKTIECSIMDIADDIAYSTYDLEDNFKAGFLTPMGLLALDEDIYDKVACTIKSRAEKQYTDLTFGQIDAALVKHVIYQVFRDVLFGVSDEMKNHIRARDTDWSTKKMLVAAEVQELSRRLAHDGYARTKFTSQLVQVFLENIEVIPHAKFPQLHQVRLKFVAFLYVEVLKNITFHAIIESPLLQVVEYRGKDIVKNIFKALRKPDAVRLLPDDFQLACRNVSEVQRMRTVCDFIAGMTDRYALEFYGRLYGSTNLTIHKPL